MAIEFSAEVTILPGFGKERRGLYDQTRLEGHDPRHARHCAGDHGADCHHDVSGGDVYDLADAMAALRAAHETSDGPEIRLLLRAYKQLKRYNDIPMVAEIEAYIAGLPTRSISSVEERLALSEKVNANPIT